MVGLEEEQARHLAADAAMTARFDGPDRATAVADWSAPRLDVLPAGLQIEIGPDTIRARVPLS